MCAPDDSLRQGFREKSLGIVGNHNDVTVLDGGIEQRKNLGLDGCRKLLNFFVVEADDLLLLSDHACFAKRRQPVVDGQEIDSRLGSTPSEHLAAFVIADESNERRLSAE